MDSELLNFLAATVIILVAAKVGGYASIRLGQPSVLGELLVGIILGPTVLNMLGGWPLFAGDDHLSASLTLFAEIGVILLMFLAGLELDLRDLLRSGRVAALAGTLGVLVPLAGGFVTARLLGVETVEAIFIGLALSATSVSISAQTLMELGVLRSKVGLGLLGAAVFDDILVVLLLSGASVVFGAAEGGAGLAVILLRMVLFLAGATGVGLFVCLLYTSFITFNVSSDLILAVLVPPLVFEATLNIKWRDLRGDMPLVLLLAIGGTLLSTFIVGGLVFQLLDIPMLGALAFGALIAATDPVAVIAFFKSLGVSKRLSLLVEGESLFNDGVAIVVFNLTIAAATAMLVTDNAPAFSLVGAIVEFLRVSVVGVGVGLALGFVVAYIILRNIDDHLIETATTVAPVSYTHLDVYKRQR